MLSKVSAMTASKPALRASIPDEDYDESADDDFNPTQAAADEDAPSSSSEDDNEADKPVAIAKSKKRKVADDELDSGDEATIKERRKRRRRRDDKDDESGGEGGSIRTRAQRQAEEVERKQHRKAVQGVVTVDVDHLWSQLSSIPIGRAALPVSATGDGGAHDDAREAVNALPAEEMITIERHIEYAGEVTTVTETVPKASKAAQQYLRDKAEDTNRTTSATKSGITKLQRPLKRPSQFEPNPLGTIKSLPPNLLHHLRTRTPSRQDVLIIAERAEAEKKKRAEKMTTVQKSALDWRGYVAQEGLKGELDEYGKSNQGYLAREEFLGRADGMREEAARSARLKG